MAARYPCCAALETNMALLYDSFGVRRFQVEVNIWPDIESFSPGELSRLYGHLNSDDLFASCELRSNMGARFEGEHWVYDVSPSSLLLRCTGYSGTDELRRIIRLLLSETRSFFHRRRAFYVGSVRAYGVVPEDKDRHIGQVVQKRLLSRVAKEELESLPGLSGAGLRLVGDTDDFHWHAFIEPPHGAYGVLGLDAQLMFWPSSEPPNADDDLDTIEEQVMMAYRLLTEDIKTFASKMFH